MRFSLHILLFCALCSGLSAQTGTFDDRWRWAHFTTESGLPSNSVHNMFEAADGTVWAATSAGLAWYDGFQWFVIDSSKGIPSSRITEIRGEMNGSLIVTIEGRLFLGGKNGFRVLPAFITNAVHYAGDTLLCLDQKSLFFFAANVQSRFMPPGPPEQSKALRLAQTKSKGLWVNFFDGLYQKNEGRWDCKIRASPPHELGISMVTENRAGSGIIAVHSPYEQRGFWEWSGHSLPKRNTEESPDKISAMDISNTGEGIAVYESGDLRFREEGKWRSLILRHMQIRDILTVQFRSNNDLWIGTEHGLYLCKRSQSRWTYWTHPPPDLRNRVHEILKARDGTVYLATGDGLEVRHPDGSVSYIKKIGDQHLSSVTGIAEDRDGNIWISSGFSFTGAYRWDQMRWRHEAIDTNDDGLYIHKIRNDREGRLWFLGIGRSSPVHSAEEPGAYVLDQNGFKHWGEPEGLKNSRVYAFSQSTDGALWFGTFAGISRYRDGKWKHWSVNHGLRIERIFTIATDSKNRIWFGTNRSTMASTIPHGLGCIDEKDSVRYFTTADGLLSSDIWDLRIDDDDNLWVATRNGLCRYADGIWSSYADESGLIQTGVWPVLPLNEKVYVGTLGRGVAILDKGEKPAPPPRLLLHDPVKDEAQTLLRWNAFAYWGELSPENMYTRYRINDTEWSHWTKKKDVSFTDLQPGDYTFHVQAKGLLGDVQRTESSITFSVPSPFYLRPIPVVVEIAIGLGVCTLIMLFVMNKRRHFRELQQSEERYRIITELMSDYAYLNRIEDNGSITVLWITESFTRVTGYTIEESKDPAFITRFIHPEDLHDSIGNIQLLLGGKATNLEGRIITKNGEVLWMHNYASPIFDTTKTRVTHIYGIAHNITERKRNEQRLRSLAMELSQTEERERRRMATFLHDIIGQTLAMCRIKLRTIQQSVEGYSAESHVRELKELLDQAIRDTQFLTFELSPPILYQLGLEPAIEWLADRMRQKHRIDFVLESDRMPRDLSDDTKGLLFQAVRELFVNIIKHAQARNVKVSFSSSGNMIRIEIADDGVGFDTQQLTATKKEGGFGLFNIRGRLTNIGGSMEIQSGNGWTGATTILTAPLETTNKNMTGDNANVSVSS